MSPSSMNAFMEGIPEGHTKYKGVVMDNYPARVCLEDPDHDWPCLGEPRIRLVSRDISR